MHRSRLTLGIASVASAVAVMVALAPAPANAQIFPPTVSIDDAGGQEQTICSDAIPLSSMVFDVTLSEPSQNEVTVQYSLRYRSASPDDAALASGETGTVTFGAGETIQGIEVTIGSDDLREPNEQVIVRLRDPEGATLGDDVGRGTILDDDDPAVERLSGPSRVETALELSRRYIFGPPLDVVLARADDFADALAGAPLANQESARLLLTSRDRLHDSVRDELIDFPPARAFLLGGPVAMSEQVAADLRAIGVGEVIRIGGRDRFDTARLIAARLDAHHAYVTRGAAPPGVDGWPDALAVSGLAAFQHRPILLVERDTLPESTRVALANYEQVTVVGGAAAVSEAVVDAIEATGPAVERVSGSSRYETSALIAERSEAAGMRPDIAWFATGRDWPDALAAGAAAAFGGGCYVGPGVFLLLDGRDLAGSPAARGWVENRYTTMTRVWLAGGPSAVSTDIQQHFADVIAE